MGYAYINTLSLLISSNQQFDASIYRSKKYFFISESYQKHVIQKMRLILNMSHLITHKNIIL
jgi:hypothetical protein